MRLLEVIQRSSAFLESRGVDSPRLQAELLLAHILRIPRLQLYLQFDRILDATTLDPLREAVRRRGQREPLQHILGSASFCGLEIQVNRNTLVPRPETEQLAEHAWTWLTQHHRPRTDAGLHALDWGTGSGCVSIALAHHAPFARITAIDVSEDALLLARRNAEHHGVSSRIHFVHADGTSDLSADDRFDLIVSNPPYIPTNDIASLATEVRDFDPVLALDGGPDGLHAYRRLAVELRRHLLPEGVLWLELGDDQAADVSRILSAERWDDIQIFRDLSGRNRFLSARPIAS